MVSIIINPFVHGGGGGGGGGGQPVIWVGKATAASGTSTISLTASYSDASGAPTSELTNDYALALFQTGDVDSITTDADWTALVTKTGNNGKLWIYYQRASTPAIGSFTALDPGNHWLGISSQFRYVKTTGTAINTSSNGTFSSSSSTITMSGVTTTVNNCLIVVCMQYELDSSGANMSGWTCSALTDFGEPSATQCDVMTTNGTGGGLALATGLMATAGSTGSITVTPGVQCDGSYYVLALEPASP